VQSEKGPIQQCPTANPHRGHSWGQFQSDLQNAAQGRAGRCEWFDAGAARAVTRIGISDTNAGITHLLAMMKVDKLSQGRLPSWANAWCGLRFRTPMRDGAHGAAMLH
jgi:hypothetical protein